MIKTFYSKIRIALALIILLVIIAVLVTSQFFWKVLYPIPYKDIIWQHATETGLDPYFIASIIRTESNFVPRALSKSGAIGLMQLMPNTAKWVADKVELKIAKNEDLYDPNTNIKLGTFYIKHLLNKYNNNTAMALAAYNSGMGRVKEWINEGIWNGSISTANEIPYDETRHFVRKVLRSYEVYTSLYGR
ncbi:lytic transglycosylase domain-containing protein [Clostridium sp. 'deep sea']|uniref:lytic transglycosylase domain-containing protein n=1 Tax=Clostridium sp. 'deep sea' TaxID=2779445 RepID=UPI001896428B|nr:lytic transglycosylase domain-containing protein [Clostridium sp. 'deep sea']QOR36443.1 lytic transglycosylase domain-containing protein [Clostridium sp. 'deep sea']